MTRSSNALCHAPKACTGNGKVIQHPKGGLSGLQPLLHRAGYMPVARPIALPPTSQAGRLSPVYLPCQNFVHQCRDCRREVIKDRATRKDRQFPFVQYERRPGGNSAIASCVRFICADSQASNLPIREGGQPLVGSWFDPSDGPTATPETCTGNSGQSGPNKET